VVQRGRVAERAQDRLDANGLDPRDAARTDGRLHLVQRGVAHRLPAREAIPEAQEGDVAVAVARRLGEDGEDELLERPAVRRGDRRPVERA
jgi:hypothetical protein